MTTDGDLKFKYIIILPVIALVSAGLNIWVTLLVGPSLNSILGGLFLVLGLLALTSPVLVFTPHAIEWRNLIGMTVKRVTHTPEQVEVVGNQVNINGKKAVSLWWTNGSSQKVIDYFSTLKNAS